ncbi:MAG TPA: TonB-dependent receptor [Blastocatellia bacterium]|jgi:hypothetical protein|nr:TonB-dependent receptor [Blastocatellia bacterium]
MLNKFKYLLLTVTVLTLAARMTIPVGAQQSPTGSIRGTVTDPQGAVIQNASVTVTNKNNGSVTTISAGSDGIYSISTLPPGEYEVKIEAQGFATQLIRVTVQVGNTTSGDAQLRVGGKDEIVDVTSDAPLINRQDYKLDGVISRQKIDALPLNGRNFLQLAQLEPGVSVSTSNPGDANNLFNVSIGGASSANTRITVDGGSVLDYVTGGAAQNFSTETIQEFQISTFNFDLSTGVTSVGAVNIVSRTGGNQFHGAAFAFWRGDQFAAVPTLQQGAPDFNRYQYGGSFGGPIKKDKALFFGNVEWLKQDSIFSTVSKGFLNINQFDANAKSPYDGFVANVRLDLPQLSKNNRMFARYSHDGNDTFAPVTGNTLPSYWRSNVNKDHNAQVGLTSAWAKKVNDLRFNYQRIDNNSILPSASQCPSADPGCLGVGGPQLRVNGSTFIIGNNENAPQQRILDRYQFSDNLVWSKGAHNVRFGGEFEHDYGKGLWAFLDPALVVLHDPNTVLGVNATINSIPDALLPPSLKAALRIPIPAAFSTPGAKITVNDILQLPIAVAFVGIGDPSQPPPFNVNKARQSNRFRFYGQDSWQVKQNLTVHYGASYLFETNLFNHDLAKPPILKPLLGKLEPSGKDKNNIAPSVGFNWAVNNKTVISGGAGIYYDTALFVTRLRERANIGPLGNGRVQVPGDFFQTNVDFVTGLPTLPGALAAFNLINVRRGTPVNFTTIPTKFTGQNFLNLLASQSPIIQAQLQALGSSGLTGVDFFKTGSDFLDPQNVTPYTEQFTIGVQRELPHNMSIKADFAFRQFMHTLFQTDYNLTNRVASRGGPVIRKCVGAEAGNPAVQCSNGALSVFQSSGRGSYRALLVKLDKRVSSKYQFTAAYTLQQQIAFSTGEDLTDWFGNHSSVGARHRFVFSGIMDLPAGFQASLISVFSTRGPGNARVPADLNGDGTTSDTLPGLKLNSLGRGTSKAELRELVSAYNTNFAGKTDARGAIIQPVFLPPTFEFGDSFQSHDVRLTKEFKFAERHSIQAIFEVFNLFNNANLGGFSGNLDQGTRNATTGVLTQPLTFNFGQPTSRAGQAFGTGGPRAMQFGAKFSF